MTAFLQHSRAIYFCKNVKPIQQCAADDHEYDKEYEGLFELRWDVQSKDVGDRFKEERAPSVLSGPWRAYWDNSVEDKRKYLDALIYSLEAVIVRDGTGPLFTVNWYIQHKKNMQLTAKPSTPFIIESRI